MRTLCRKSFAIGLLVALLVVYTGRAVPVFALADPVPDVWLKPVYDTDIISFSNYVENELTDPQFEIFKIALGVYIAAQAGANKYDLVDPYTTSDGLLGWIKSLGLTAYNELNGLVPDTIRDPVTGGMISTAPLKESVKYLVAYGMGAAVLAANYSTEQDFIDDMQESQNFFFEFGPRAQIGINALVAINGGFYDWQFSPAEWTTNFSWSAPTATGNLLAEYNAAVANLTYPHVACNSNNQYVHGAIGYSPALTMTYDLWIDTANHYVKILGGYNVDNSIVVFHDNSYARQRTTTLAYTQMPYTAANFNDYRDIVQFALDHNYYKNSYTLWYFAWRGDESYYFDLAPFIRDVYVGPDMDHLVLLENVGDLNLADVTSMYYDQLESEYLFDIRQFLIDLLNRRDLHDPWYLNLYDLGGDLVTNPPIIRISIDFPQSEALPVNLNDIADYTDNTYFDRVKEEARKFGDIFAAFVAFWHNVDYDLVYILFGFSITVLVGAFIGKWGHS